MVSRLVAKFYRTTMITNYELRVGEMVGSAEVITSLRILMS
jgi:hypothetical protein